MNSTPCHCVSTTLTSKQLTRVPTPIFIGLFSNIANFYLKGRFWIVRIISRVSKTRTNSQAGLNSSIPGRLSFPFLFLDRNCEWEINEPYEGEKTLCYRCKGLAVGSFDHGFSFFASKRLRSPNPLIRLHIPLRLSSAWSLTSRMALLRQDGAPWAKSDPHWLVTRQTEMMHWTCGLRYGQNFPFCPNVFPIRG